MSFVKPMLASPMSANFNPTQGTWVAEEKYDGHRLYVEVRGTDVKAWSRNELPRILPPHVRHDLARLPDGAYDGELISTEKTKSYGVTELVQADKLCFVVFDLLTTVNTDIKDRPYYERRQLLEEIFKNVLATAGVTYSCSRPARTNVEIATIASGVWNRGGEGLILKNIHEPYLPGKRSKNWIKIKQCHTAVLKVVGFVPGKLGPYSTVLLEDSEGCQTTVKTLNTHERLRLEEDPETYIGQRLRIEFQERTPDGSYRHPMWDRWEEA